MKEANIKSDLTDGDEIKRAPVWGSSRLALTFVEFFGCISLYLMRINMSVAIVCMTRDPVSNDNASTTTPQTDSYYKGFDSSDDCEGDEVEDSEGTGEFEWDRELRGFVNSSFFIGYILTQVLGGWLAAKFGAKWVLGLGILLTAIATLLSPVAARGSVYLLMVMRAIKGLGSGVYFPAFHQMWAVWAPLYERSILVASVISGNSWGSIFSFFVSGIICDSIGWEWVFYIYGIVACVWFVFWVLFAFDNPSTHPRISEEEREFLKKSIDAQPKAKEKLDTPWLKLFTSGPVWAVTIGGVCHAWGGYTSLTSTTQYMRDVLKFDIRRNGMYNSLPYICQFVFTFIFATGTDFIRAKKIVSTTTIRKIGFMCACVPPAGFLVAVAFLDCNDAMAAVAILCLAQGFASASRSSQVASMVDIAPRYSGIIMGISNTAATVPGIVAPIVTGYLTPNGSTQEWQRVFFISAGLYFLGFLVFVFLGSGEVQPWGRQAKDAEESFESVDKTDGSKNLFYTVNGSVDNQPTEMTKF